MTDRYDETLRVFVSVTAFKANLPDSFISIRYGDEFNSLVDRLERATGLPLEEYKLKASDQSPTPQIRTRGNAYYEAPLFRIRIDGLLGYLQTLVPEAKAKAAIGFQTKRGT